MLAMLPYPIIFQLVERTIFHSWARHGPAGTWGPAARVPFFPVQQTYTKVSLFTLHYAVASKSRAKHGLL